jgi:hypothetical protein
VEDDLGTHAWFWCVLEPAWRMDTRLTPAE